MIYANARQSLDPRNETGRYGKRAESSLGYSSFWPDPEVSSHHLRNSCESRSPMLFGVKSQKVSAFNHRELTRCLEVLRPDLEKNVSEGESDPRTPDGDDESDNK